MVALAGIPAVDFGDTPAGSRSAHETLGVSQSTKPWESPSAQNPGSRPEHTTLGVKNKPPTPGGRACFPGVNPTHGYPPRLVVDFPDPGGSFPLFLANAQLLYGPFPMERRVSSSKRSGEFSADAAEFCRILRKALSRTVLFSMKIDAKRRAPGG